MKKYLYIHLNTALFCFLPSAHGALSPVAASLLWGRHRDVYGIDLGLIANQTKKDFVGVGIAGGVNWTHCK